ncbi:hypothetical protein LSPH24S_08871 [Lysinibacillus sphaericus]|nr:hypothetical protein LSP03_00180 [Lysinibacillus sphaericus]
MKKLSFLFQFMVNPKTIGAIVPSSSFLGDKMIEKIACQKKCQDRCIISRK